MTPATIKASGLGNNDRAKLWYIQGMAYENSGKYERAYNAYKEVLETAPTGPDAQSAKQKANGLVKERKVKNKKLLSYVSSKDALLKQMIAKQKGSETFDASGYFEKLKA